MKSSISNLVCSALREDRQLKCTPVSLKMTEGLVKVASTRIFADPEQSFAELVVNSIDAYKVERGQDPIGKFGMGFYSILYWLFDNHKNTITITSRYLVGSGVYEAYKAELKYVEDEGPFLTIIPLNSDTRLPKVSHYDQHGGSGTVISINANYDIKKAEKYVNRVKYTDKSLPPVAIEIIGGYFAVGDSSTGIPYTVLVNTLLVPSVSSKVRPKMLPYDLEPLIEKSPSSLLEIVVGGVVVYSNEILSPSRSSLKCSVMLPSTTPLPVARDDVLYDKEVEGAVIHQLYQIATRNIQMGSVIEIFQQLDKYGMYSTQSKARKVVNEIKRYINDYPGVVYLKNNSSLLKFAKDSFKSLVKSVEHPNPSLYRSEQQLKPMFDILKLKDPVFHLKDVIHTEDKTINLSGYVITNTKIDKWKSKLISSNAETLLLPVEEVYSGHPYSSLKALGLSTKCSETLNIFYATWESVTKNCDTKKSYDIPEVYFNLAYKVFSEDKFIEFVVTFNYLLASTKYDFTYGSSAKILGVNYERALTDAKKFNGVYEPHNTEVIFWFFTLVEKHVTGSFTWLPDVRPFFLVKRNGNGKYGDSTSDFDNKMIEEGLNLCITPGQKIMFYHIYYKVSNRVNKNVKGLSEHIVNEIQRFGGKGLDGLIRAFVNNLVTGAELGIKVIDPVIASITFYTQSFDTILPPVILFDKCVSARQLTTFLYSEDTTLMNAIEIMDSAVIKQPKINKLQTVAIAVNEGTTKDFGSSVITELAQNSVDAIRTANSPLQSVDDRITVNMHNNGFSITDHVGISYKDLIYILVPFVSSKKSDDINVTGEMGTGFFNSYRYPWSEGVVISSHKDDVTVYILGIPVISEGKVIDIKYNYQYQHNPGAKNGTTISIYFTSDLRKKTEALTDVYTFLRGYMAYIDSTIYVGDKQLYGSKNLIYSGEIGSVYVTDDKNVRSFVMTNGVPFLDLDSFVEGYEGFQKSFLKYGNLRVIIDINKGYYRASQSRTKIAVDPKSLSDFVGFLSNTVHLAILYIYSEGTMPHPDEIINFSSSVANISSLKLWTNVSYSSKRLIPEGNGFHRISLYDNPLSGEVQNIGATINSYISGFGTGLRSDLIDVKDTIFGRAIKHWFLNKDTKPLKIKDINIVGTAQNGVSFTKNTGLSNTSDKNIALDMPWLQRICDAYWFCVSKMFESGYLKTYNSSVVGKLPPRVVVVDMEKGSGILGYYSSSKHLIAMNVNFLEPNKIISSMDTYRVLYAKNPDLVTSKMRSNSDISGIINPAMPSTTFLHEMLHAITSSDHSASHDTPNIINGCNGKSFDEVAVLIYIKACELGLFGLIFS
jgi:hypothetical protein